MLTAVLLAIVLLLDKCVLQTTQTDDEQQLSKPTGNQYFQIPSTYSRNVPPTPEKGPLIVRVEILVWFITEISLTKMDLELDLYITFWWHDQRVKLLSNLTETTTWVSMGKEALPLWRPYVIYRNCKGCFALDLDPVKNGMQFNQLDHTLMSTTRSLTRFFCPFDLSAFPMDKQLCKIQLVNYYEDTSKLLFDHVFDKSHSRVGSKQILAEFLIESITQGNCTWPIHDGTILSCIEMKMLFVRQMGFYWVTLYAPTLLIVILSWVSFWLPMEAVPARVTLGVTSLLTLATRLDQSQKNLPPVSYVKAIDVWLFACIFLVFSSLVEFAVAHYVGTNHIKVVPRYSAPTFTTVTQVIYVAYHLNEIRPFCEQKNRIASAKAVAAAPVQQLQNSSVDRISRYAFPATFFIFNCIYWIYYKSAY